MKKNHNKPVAIENGEASLAIAMHVISYIAHMPAVPLLWEDKDSLLIHDDCKSCKTSWRMPISIC